MKTLSSGGTESNVVVQWISDLLSIFQSRFFVTNRAMTWLGPIKIISCLSSPPSPIFDSREKFYLIYCAYARCALIRILVCTN